MKNNSCFCKTTVFLFMLIFLFGGCGEPKIQIKSKPLPFENVITTISTSTNYIIGVGDKLEVLYQTNPRYTIDSYLIGLEDELRIRFYYYPELNKSAIVRPDGYITLHKIGDIKAIGMKPASLAQKISELYRSHLTKPVVTVEVIEFDVRAKELQKAIRTITRGQSRLVVVRPDGMISLPYIDEVRAAGLTCNELSRRVELNYSKFIDKLDVTVALLEARSNRAYIMGAVKRPNFYELLGPTSLTQLIAMAGGFLDGANTHQVVAITRGSKGQPMAKLIDMDDIIGQGDITSDPIIRKYDVVFVPKTKIAQAAIVGNALWRLIPDRFGVYYDIKNIWGEE